MVFQETGRTWAQISHSRFLVCRHLVWLRGCYSICSHPSHHGRPVPELTSSSLNQPQGPKEVLRLHWRIQRFLPKQLASLGKCLKNATHTPIPCPRSHTGESSRLGTNPVEGSSFPMSSPPPNSSPIHITAFEWSHDLEWLVCAVLSQSVMSDFLSPWTVAHQAPLSMGFSRQESWSGLPLPSSRAGIVYTFRNLKWGYWVIFLKEIIIKISAKLPLKPKLTSGFPRLCQRKLGTCHLPLQGLNHVPLHLLKGVQGRGQEWGALCSGKNWQNRPSDS